MKRLSYHLLAGMMIVPAMVLASQDDAPYFNLLLAVVFVMVSLMVVILGQQVKD